MSVLKEVYKLQSEHLIKAIKSRNMDACYVETKEAAKAKVLEIIEENSTVSFGGSESLKEAGILDALRDGNYNLLDRDNAKSQEEVEKIYLDSFRADYYLMSANAISLDGKLINIDGRSNRTAALIFGATNVIVVASMNKVCPDEESALKRARSFAAVANVKRLNKKTPCSITGVCSDCNSPDCICCNTVVTRNSGIKNRIKVILVGENLGF